MSECEDCNWVCSYCKNSECNCSEEVFELNDEMFECLECGGISN